MNERKDASVKKMAELLRQGATMLAEACPQCGSPLLKVGEDIYCAMCDRRIVYADADEDIESQAVRELIPKLRETLLTKLDTLNDVIERETDAEALTKLANLMVLLLQALHRLETMEK
ncbi:MAG: Sjogren's syndrome/scleroderma autoantigen 1 family protein [Candidatus Thorarchaeota archaeon]|nr:Sjogren's syndrome/scleroderma autoantigen 1 family protein [Candidatus Thorarchaeota archaeon]